MREAAGRSRRGTRPRARRGPRHPRACAARAAASSRDLHEHGDAVALGDRLAQPSGAHDVDANRSPVGDRVQPADRIRSRGAARREARLPARCGVDRQVDPRARPRRRDTGQSGTRSTAAPTRRSDGPRTRRGRAGSSRTSPGSTAGTRTSSRSPRAACSSRTPSAFTTALFHEVYLGEPATGFEELVERPYDLRVVCGLDVPWRHDGIREFEKQRRWMHERYVEHARSSGAPWLVVEGPLEERVRVVADAVAAVLG